MADGRHHMMSFAPWKPWKLPARVGEAMHIRATRFKLVSEATLRLRSLALADTWLADSKLSLRSSIIQVDARPLMRSIALCGVGHYAMVSSQAFCWWGEYDRLIKTALQAI